jgi:hypothetical protein
MLVKLTPGLQTAKDFWLQNRRPTIDQVEQVDSNSPHLFGPDLENSVLPPGVNVINILRKAFTHADPKRAKSY